MNLFDLIMQEYFAIVNHLLQNLNQKGKVIIVDSNLFYSLIDKNLYIKRNEKLKTYKQLNLISCNDKGYTSVIYDKDVKKAKRKIVVNLETYRQLKKLYQIEIEV